MAGKETAVYVTAGSTSSGARARSGTRRRRRRRRVRRGEETRRRGIRRRTEAVVLAGEPSRRNMAAGCCGAKKQRLGVGGVGGGGATPSLSSCDSTVIRHGVPHPRKPTTIAQPEMGFFCFDVLYCQLHQLDPPKAPNFSNEALWVALAFDMYMCLSLSLSISLPPSLSVLSRASRQLLSPFISDEPRCASRRALFASRRLRFLRLNFEIREKGTDIIFTLITCQIFICICLHYISNSSVFYFRYLTFVEKSIRHRTVALFAHLFESRVQFICRTLYRFLEFFCNV